MEAPESNGRFSPPVRSMRQGLPAMGMNGPSQAMGGGVTQPTPGGNGLMRSRTTPTTTTDRSHLGAAPGFGATSDQQQNPTSSASSLPVSPSGASGGRAFDSRLSRLTSTLEKKVKDIPEAIDIFYEISTLLDTGLDKETVAILVSLIELGCNPDALARAVREVRNLSEEEEDPESS